MPWTGPGGFGVGSAARTKLSPPVPSQFPSKFPFAFDTFDAKTVSAYRPSARDRDSVFAPPNVNVTWDLPDELSATAVMLPTKALSDNRWSWNASPGVAGRLTT